MKNIFFFIFLSSFLFSCKPYEKSYTEKMKIDLKMRFDKEQKAQDFDIVKIESKGRVYTDSMNLEKDRIFEENTDTIKKYFDEYSFPWVKINGEKTSIYFWTIVQHSDHDVKFQEQVLRRMKKGLKIGEVLPRNYAYLYDRVMKNKNKKQLYGTQVEWKSATPTPFPELKNPDKVNEYRKKMGLETLEEYYQSFSN